MDLEQFLSNDLLIKFHQQVLDLILAERNKQLSNYLQMQDIFYSSQTRLINQHDQIVKKIQDDHDKEISNQHTVALKMSLIKEYDEKNAILQREIDYLKNQLQRKQLLTQPVTPSVAQLVTPSVVQPVAVITVNPRSKLPEGEKSESLPTSPVTISQQISKPSTDAVAVESVNLANSPSVNLANNYDLKPDTSNNLIDNGQQATEPNQSGELTLPLPDKQVEPTVSETKDVSDQSGLPLQSRLTVESNVQRKKIKWRDVWYYYDVTSMDVYGDKTSQVVIGKKRDKKLELLG